MEHLLNLVSQTYSMSGSEGGGDPYAGELWRWRSVCRWWRSVCWRWRSVCTVVAIHMQTVAIHMQAVVIHKAGELWTHMLAVVIRMLEDPYGGDPYAGTVVIHMLAVVIRMQVAVIRMLAVAIRMKAGGGDPYGHLKVVIRMLAVVIRMHRRW